MATIKYFDNYTDTGMHLSAPNALRSQVKEALDLNRGGLRLFVVATTKKAAVEAMESVGFERIRPTHLRTGSGNDLSKLIASGVMGQGEVFAMSNSWSVDTPVVRLTKDSATVVGYLRQDHFEAA